MAGAHARLTRRHPKARIELDEALDWLIAPRSASMQTSPVHVGRCTDLDVAMEKLLQKMVRPPAA